MKREELSDIIGGIDEQLVVEASRYDSTLGGRSPERIVHMKKKRIITFALAAALVIALGVGAYAAGIFGGKPEVTIPSRASNFGVWWDLHDNLPTAEIEAMLAEMKGKKEFSTRSFSSLQRMEDAYGIELLKLGSQKDYVQTYLYFGKLSGYWNALEDGVYLSTDFRYYFGDPDNHHSFKLGKSAEHVEYEIRSLGVTAQLFSIGSGQRRTLEACFSYGGIDYDISAILNPDYSTKKNLDDVGIDWLCAKLETLQKPSWVSETAGPSWETTSNVTVFLGDEYPGLHSFDSEAAGPSGVILTTRTIDHDAYGWEDYPNADVYMTAKWAPHDNLPTAEMEALLAEVDPKVGFSRQAFDSVDEMEVAYGIELLQLNAENSYVQGSITRALANNASFYGHWKSTVKGISVKTLACYHFIVSTEAIPQQIPATWKSIDKESEYKIRSLGVTARVVSGLKDTEEAERCVMAFFTYDGVDYCITATADGGKEPTIRWLCRQLEKLHY